MTKILLTLVLTISLLPTMMFGVSCDGKSEVTTTTPVTTTEFYDGQELDVHAALFLGSSLTPGLFLSDVEVFTSTIPQGGIVTVGGTTMYSFNKGDRCLNVIGNINNETDQFLYMNMKAFAYNSDMEIAGMPISITRSSGNSFYYLPEHTVTEFKLIVTWAKDVKLVEIYAASDNTDEWVFHEI